MKNTVLLLAMLSLAHLCSLDAATGFLAPAASRADAPLKGLVPYLGQDEADFPHSMEFDYLPLAELMKGRETFDWTALDAKLGNTAERGLHLIFRIWLEYPGKEGGIPGFLIQEGVKVTRWKDADEKYSIAPDYADERLISALEQFIAALGARYDGDPRVGYITAGLLGSWGEWHNYPREDLAAPVGTQRRVLVAYQKAFRQIPVLLRYPANEQTEGYAPNAALPFGYHDDSFAWATIDDGEGRAESWFYMMLLQAAGPAALEKWRANPIGGEIRPEVWGIIFDDKPAHQKAQDFAECVRQTHVTWLMDSGMFGKGNSPERRARAIEQVRKMGYEFQVLSANVSRQAGSLKLKLDVINRGVAPFYRDWALEVALLAPDGEIIQQWPVDWKVTGILPDQTAPWSANLTLEKPLAAGVLALRVVNPLPKGKAVGFANAGQDQHRPGWLSFAELK